MLAMVLTTVLVCVCAYVLELFDIYRDWQRRQSQRSQRGFVHGIPLLRALFINRVSGIFPSILGQASTQMVRPIFAPPVRFPTNPSAFEYLLRPGLVAVVS
jgi:hypothetical protein